MINSNNIFGLHEHALVARSKRSEVLANNIANADTPGFKARDIDFSQALEQATRAQRVGYEKSSENQKIGDELQYRIPLQPDTGDGNTVDAEYEKSQFAQNALQYQTTLTFLNSRVRGLRTAIKGE